jgi:hypothetical protein
MVNKTTREGRALLDLLAACWEIEDSSGGWNGGDVVDLVTQTFDALGLEITHPSEQDGGTGDTEDYDRATLDAFARGEGTHPEPPNPALDENGDWRTCDEHGGAITQDCDCDPRGDDEE